MKTLPLFHKEINDDCSIRVLTALLIYFDLLLLAETHLQKGFPETLGNPIDPSLVYTGFFFSSSCHHNMVVIIANFKSELSYQK